MFGVASFIYLHRKDRKNKQTKKNDVLNSRLKRNSWRQIDEVTVDTDAKWLKHQDKRASKRRSIRMDRFQVIHEIAWLHLSEIRTSFSFRLFLWSWTYNLLKSRKFDRKCFSMLSLFVIHRLIYIHILDFFCINSYSKNIIFNDLFPYFLLSFDKFFIYDPNILIFIGKERYYVCFTVFRKQFFLAWTDLKRL